VILTVNTPPTAAVYLCHLLRDDIVTASELRAFSDVVAHGGRGIMAGWKDRKRKGVRTEEKGAKARMRNAEAGDVTGTSREGRTMALYTEKVLH